jgi:hypothetical protein
MYLLAINRVTSNSILGTLVAPTRVILLMRKSKFRPKLPLRIQIIMHATALTSHGFRSRVFSIRNRRVTRTSITTAQDRPVHGLMDIPIPSKRSAGGDGMLY